VLRGVDFDVARGSISALLGSNGAGKTTVVNILSTLLKPDAGTASVNGFEVATQPADVRASISLTGQFAAVDEILTGRENLVLVARLRRVEGPGQVADALLARFQLTDAAGRRVSTYSGGERRRLDIAMSLIGKPPWGHPLPTWRCLGWPGSRGKLTLWRTTESRWVAGALVSGRPPTNFVGGLPASSPGHPHHQGWSDG
jgi:ABC-type cobalamin transport system ATPase subunit